MTTIYFTLCSNNYLPFALSLGKSIRQFLSDSRFVVGLVDRIHPEIDYSSLGDFEYLPCFDLGYPEFEIMLSGYNIIEFNTAVKPFYFEYLFRNNPNVDRIYYIDPDILFYQSPELLDRHWTKDASIQLTPNLLRIPEHLVRGELASLKHGYNNLGYIGMQRGPETDRIIQWWKERLRTHCKLDKCRGIFVDQKWMDLAPLFFKGIVSVKHSGWNMAWWNLSERKLGKNEQGYFVNDPNIPLVFFHFSGFKPGAATMTERIQSSEFDMESEGALRELFDDYEKKLLANGFEILSKKKPLLKFKELPNQLRHRIGRKLKSKMTNAIFRIFGV
ncbi:hypothetical protein DFQ04_1399 [Algoriphagus boseongensis]|uniref:Glycosyl transferase n=1 Tax=Algoriphagus boseongensis TaxID=1442587 RepID=A0A4R6TA03_9BACT|nr:hypothetical protein [Algoriphagus boseongensis]TDQ19576.1 hypothetical protein DFQ04_1399 [Algoriphagus boseongensis]